jgi:hypothetical protein
VADRTFKVIADEQFFPSDALRKLAEYLVGEGIRDEDWWIQVDFGRGPESTPDPRRAQMLREPT